MSEVCVCVCVCMCVRACVCASARNIVMSQAARAHAEDDDSDFAPVVSLGACMHACVRWRGAAHPHVHKVTLS
jgi:hypothetical protein